MEFYISPQSDQCYMINVLENQWLSVTYKSIKHVYEPLASKASLNVFI